MSTNHIPFRSAKPNSFHHQPIINNSSSGTITPPRTKKNRQTRSDKCHDVKFPVTTEEKVRLKIALKQSSHIYQRFHDPDQKLTQTNFNTALLRYSLRAIKKDTHFVLWDRLYADSPSYMHTKPKEFEYDDIGGTYGLATLKGLSDRKTVYCLVISALESLEKGGVTHEDILRFAK